jgi:WD40 repeat protein
VNNTLEVYHINSPDSSSANPNPAPNLEASSSSSSSSGNKKKNKNNNALSSDKNKEGEEREEEGGGEDVEDAADFSVPGFEKGEIVVKQSVIELHGHRSDVRAVCLSSDGLQAATCSSDGVKVWSTRLFTCMRSCPTGYGVSVAFAPGGRYVITGTKDGKLQVRNREIFLNSSANKQNISI